MKNRERALPPVTVLHTLPLSTSLLSSLLPLHPHSPNPSLFLPIPFLHLHLPHILLESTQTVFESLLILLLVLRQTNPSPCFALRTWMTLLGSWQPFVLGTKAARPPRLLPFTTRPVTKKLILNLLLLSLAILLLLSLFPHLPARSLVTTVVARATRLPSPRKCLVRREISLLLAVLLRLNLCLRLPVHLLVTFLVARTAFLPLALRSLASLATLLRKGLCLLSPAPWLVVLSSKIRSLCLFRRKRLPLVSLSFLLHDGLSLTETFYSRPWLPGEQWT